MSEAVRNYSFGRPRKTPRRAPSLRVPGGILALLIVIALPFALYFLWISRDSRNVEDFIASGRGLEMVIRDPLAARARMADSFLWTVLPEDHALTALPAGLRTEIDLPDWMTRNLSGETWYVGADTGSELENVLLITRVSRVGVGIERMQRFKPTVSRSPAGGLDVYYWAPHAVYYALRGRVLLVSPSRRTLITALTLDTEERAAPEALTGLFAEGPEDLKGRYVCVEGEPLHAYFHSLSFALDTNASGITLQLLGAPQPELEARLAPIVAEAPASALPAPPDGPLRLSANLGQSVRESWTTLGRIFDTPWLNGAQWAAWEAGEPGTYGAALTSVLGDTGPAFTAAWRGFDLDEMMPAPIVVGRAQSRGGDLKTPMTLVTENGAPEDCPLPLAYTGDADGRVYIPAISGPSLEAVVERGADWTRFSSSRTSAEEFFGQAEAARSPGDGHVYVGMEPNAILDLFKETGMFLAENGMLRDHTSESWNAQIGTWRERWASAETIDVRMAAKRGRVEATVTIALMPPADQTPSSTVAR